MKRLRVLILTATLVGLAGCKQTASPPPPSNAGGAPAATSTTIPSPTAQTADIPEEQASLAEDAPEAVSEFGDDSESVETASTAAQPLALRIADTSPPPASEYKEGVHYLRLVPTQPTLTTGDQVEVTEAFWYGCSHCNALDPSLESWRMQGKPAYVNFVRLPVIWNERTRLHARLFYTAELLGKLDELHPEIFREMHVNGKALNTPDSIAAFFMSHGVSKEAFDKAFSSFAVESSLKQAATLNMRYRVESVPTLIINGKYVTDVGKAGSQKALIALINELASRERGI